MTCKCLFIFSNTWRTSPLGGLYQGQVTSVEIQAPRVEKSSLGQSAALSMSESLSSITRTQKIKKQEEKRKKRKKQNKTRKKNKTISWLRLGVCFSTVPQNTSSLQMTHLQGANSLTNRVRVSRLCIGRNTEYNLEDRA